MDRFICCRIAVLASDRDSSSIDVSPVRDTDCASAVVRFDNASRLFRVTDMFAPTVDLRDAMDSIRASMYSIVTVAEFTLERL